MEAQPVSIRIPGIVNDVLIRRDGRGIPYIEAQNESDLCIAFGYTVAGDRLWQMELTRRTAYGRLAEILGPDLLEEDKQFRSYGFDGLCGQILAGLPEPVRRTLEWFAGGVNARMSAFDAAALPLEFQILKFQPEPWRAQDGIAVGKVLAESLSSHWMAGLMMASFASLTPAVRSALLQNNSPLDLLIVGHDNVLSTFADSARLNVAPPSVRLDAVSNNRLLDMVLYRDRSLQRLGLKSAGLKAASNNWVVSGKHTATGKPLLANDPHLNASAPCLWYTAHLSAPGLRAAGVTIPGLPSILIGHNDYVAWGFTNLGGDEQDLYKESFSPTDPLLYRTPDGWEQAGKRNERITVRDASGATTFQDFPVLTTRHGPIVFNDGTSSYALRWTAFDSDSTELVSIHLLNRAASTGEIHDALAAYTGPSMNCVWANRDGDIGYHLVGKIPEREDGDGSTPYDGTTERGRWNGYVAFDELPSVGNPASGIIVTANNRLIGESYPHFITHGWDVPYRARRIWNLLYGENGLDVARMMAIQLDTYAYGEAMFVEELVKTASTHSGVTEWVELLNLLKGWDGCASKASQQMPMASEMRLAFSRAVIEDKLGPDLTRGYWWWPNRENFIDRVLRTRPSIWLPKAFASWDDLFLSCHQTAIAELEKKAGPDRTGWTWARTSQPIRFEHPLAQSDSIFSIDPIPRHTGGAENPTVNRGEFVSMRLVTSPANWDETRLGLTLGQSGDPKSSHWKDQLTDWAQGTTQIFPFTQNAIAGATKIVQALIVNFPGDQQRRSEMGVGQAFGKALGVHNLGDIGELTLKDIKLGDARSLLSSVGAGGALDFLSGIDPNAPLGNIKVKDIQQLATGLGSAPGASTDSPSMPTKEMAMMPQTDAIGVPMPMPLPLPRPRPKMMAMGMDAGSAGAPLAQKEAGIMASTGSTVGAAEGISPILSLLMGAKDLRDMSNQEKDIVLNKLLAAVAADATLVAALKGKLTAIIAELKGA